MREVGSKGGGEGRQGAHELPNGPDREAADQTR